MGDVPVTQVEEVVHRRLTAHLLAHLVDAGLDAGGGRVGLGRVDAAGLAFVDANDDDRPVRKVFPSDIPEGLFLQLDFIAVL